MISDCVIHDLLAVSQQHCPCAYLFLDLLFNFVLVDSRDGIHHFVLFNYVNFLFIFLFGLTDHFGGFFKCHFSY